jgi:hypothetical protein
MCRWDARQWTGRLIPHLDINADMGNFVHAVPQRPPGQHYIAEGSTCSWTEYIHLWSEITGPRAGYKQVTLDELMAATPDEEFGREVGDMFLLRAEDIRKVRTELPLLWHQLLDDFVGGISEWVKRRKCE